jgi:hypothetical protein
MYLPKMQLFSQEFQLSMNIEHEIVKTMNEGRYIGDERDTSAPTGG